MEDSDVVEIPPPVNWPSKPKSLKRQKVLCPDIIDLDDYQDFSVSGKSDPNFKGKQVFVDLSDNYSAQTSNYASGSDVKGSKYSKGTFNEEDLIYVDDELMEYALAQSLLDAPAGIDVSMPWVTDANGNNMNSFAASTSTRSASRPRDDPNKGFTSSKAYGLRAHSGFGKKSLPPHGHVGHSVQNQNQTSTAANKFPKSLAPLEQAVHGLPNLYTTAANSFPNALMSTRKRRFNNLGPNMYTGMNSNVGVNHMFPYSTAWNHSSPNFMGIQTDSTFTGIFSSSPGPSSFKIVNENPDVILKKLDLFKKFDTADDCSDHSFCNSNAFAMNQPPRSWAKKIQDEWRILENGLPDTIFVRLYESRMDLLRAAIIGAEGTPYHDGLFFFDVFFPSDYPNVPPQVKYHSGGLRINPNLYYCGKVCLSLLNTWTGDKKQMWIPAKSTILQVLVSIQGLILNEEPVFNEPGFVRLKGKAAGEKRSLDYNEKTLINSLKTMVYSIRRPPKHFEDLVVGHFFKRAHDILVACRAYKNGAQVGSVVVKGGVESASNKGQKGNSQSFKNDLAVCLKMLVEAFGQVGVKDCDRFLH